MSEKTKNPNREQPTRPREQPKPDIREIPLRKEPVPNKGAGRPPRN